MKAVSTSSQYHPCTRGTNYEDTISNAAHAKKKSSFTNPLGQATQPIYPSTNNSRRLTMKHTELSLHWRAHNICRWGQRHWRTLIGKYNTETQQKADGRCAPSHHRMYRAYRFWRFSCRCTHTLSRPAAAQNGHLGHLTRVSRLPSDGVYIISATYYLDIPTML